MRRPFASLCSTMVVRLILEGGRYRCKVSWPMIDTTRMGFRPFSKRRPVASPRGSRAPTKNDQMFNLVKIRLYDYPLPARYVAILSEDVLCSSEHHEFHNASRCFSGQAQQRRRPKSQKAFPLTATLLFRFYWVIRNTPEPPAGCSSQIRGRSGRCSLRAISASPVSTIKTPPASRC